MLPKKLTIENLRCYYLKFCLAIARPKYFLDIFKDNRRYRLKINNTIHICRQTNNRNSRKR